MRKVIEPAGAAAAGTRSWHTATSTEVGAAMTVDTQHGLSEAEAAARLSHYGPNRLLTVTHEPWWEELLEALREPLILLLLVVGALYAIWGGLTDALTIFAVIFAVVAAEVVNEQRAHTAIAALSRLAEPTVSVRRAGRDQAVATETIVPGDVLVLEAGQRLAADARLVATSALTADESALTGESVPVEKDATVTVPDNTPLAERRNLVFAGTAISRGRGLAVVVATGPATELGQIAELTRSVKPPRTPLQRTMQELSHWLVWVALAVSTIVPVLGWLISGQSLKETVLIGLSLAFATIPEELPILITVVLALGAYRLSQRHAIVKRLQAAETLSTVDVIATDKTGTLTENQMQVRQIVSAVPDERVFTLAVLANDAVTRAGAVVGDPVDIAFVQAAAAAGIATEALRRACPLVQEFPFDTDRKLLSVLYERNGETRSAVKGAPEAVIGRAAYQVTRTTTVALTAMSRRALLTTATELAAAGLRVLAVAEKILDKGSLSQAVAETDLTFVGFVGLADPPRAAVPAAIADCRAAGIRTIMVTGDHPVTAQAIAAQVGLPTNGHVLTGPELDALSDERLADVVGQVSVYARTTPAHKLRIVGALRRRGAHIAVTGDGVNDAPALAAADIGIAMGEMGTDVAREAADIVLADDNFATIVHAIREGRLLFANLSKAIRFYLAAKVALVAATLLPVLLGIPVPFAPIQIVVTELFMDVAASATFVAERSEADLMRRPPRDPTVPFLNRAMVTSIGLAAAGLFGAVALAYLIMWYRTGNLTQARTVAFDTWLIGHVLLALQLRSEHEPVLRLGLFSNRLLVVWAIAATAFAGLFTLVPVLHPLFKTTSIPSWAWGLTIGTAVAGTSWLEVRKWMYMPGRVPSVVTNPHQNG